MPEHEMFLPGGRVELLNDAEAPADALAAFPELGEIGLRGASDSL
jgi:hypothetical protein